MANPLAITLHASTAAETVSGSSASVDIGTLRSCARLTLDVPLVSSGASISIAIETSVTGSGSWKQVAIVTPAQREVTVAGLLRYVRCSWTLMGTLPSVSFSLSGTAHVLYATPFDIGRLSLPVKALANVEDAVKADACLAATDEADGYLGGGFTLPLVAWSDDLRRHVANMAAMTVMKFRGFQPGGSDDLIVKAHDDAISWLSKIMRHGLEPAGIIDSTPTEYEGGASVASGTKRGRFF
jgi:phage gp36-like protein